MDPVRIIAGLREALAAAMFYRETGVEPQEWAADWPTADPAWRQKYREQADALAEEFQQEAPLWP